MMIRNRKTTAVVGAAALLCLGASFAPVRAQDAPSAAPADAPAVAAPAKHEAASKARRAKPEAKPAAAAESPAAVAMAPPPAPARVCVLSRETIIGNSAVNQAIAERLAQLRQAAQTEIATATATLQTDTKTLDADKRPATDEGLKKARADLDARGRAIAQRADLLTRELEATRQSVNVQLQNAVGPLIEAVEKQQGCTLLLARDAVIDGGSAADVTQPVLAAMNAQLHPQAFGLATLAPATTK